MLAKKYRLPSTAIKAMRGSAAKGRYFLIKTAPTALPYSRFAVVVSKNVSKKATGRVALRRLIFQAIHSLPLSLTPAKEVVISLLPLANIDQKDAMIRELH